MPEIIGHRGWPTRYPDNTLAGFLAVSDVADGVELDVRRSADGKLVLAHDPVLAGHVVFETSWQVMAEADLGGGHHPALLDEVLAALPKTPVQLEVKNDPAQPGFEPDHRLALETAERARPGDTLTSFNRETLAAVRRVFPEISTGLAVESPGSLEEAIQHCLGSGHRALVAEDVLLEGPAVGDIDVYVWTVNSPARARELAEYQVSGIITDDAGLIATALGRDT